MEYDLEENGAKAQKSPKRKGKKKKKGKHKKRVNNEGIGKERFALKMFFPLMNYQMIEMEFIFNKLLSQVGVCPPLCGGLPRLDQMTFMLSEFQESDSFHALLDTMSQEYIQCYMFEMLKGIYVLERMGLMHRDLKPSNFLYSHNTRRGYITDFGLAEVVLTSPPEQPLNQEDSLILRLYELQKQGKIFNRYGTRGYMAPEVVFNQELQSTAVDVWSAGVTLLSMLTRHHPNMLPVDRETIASDKVKDILPFVCLFGYEGVIKLATQVFSKKCLKIECELALPSPYHFIKPLDIENLICERFSKSFKKRGADLLRKIFIGDWTIRYTAADALAHDFFKEVRGRQIAQIFKD